MNAIEIGSRVFGGEYLQTHKGMFWGFYETRPYMRCLFCFAEELYGLGRKSDAITVFKDIIDLNNNDNMGARDYLMLYLLDAGDIKGYELYSKMFKSDIGAFCDFNKVLYSYKKNGESMKTKNLLLKAIKNNHFVLPMLVSSKVQKFYADKYGIGSKEEAKYYATVAQRIWQSTPGIIKWAMKYRMQ